MMRMVDMPNGVAGGVPPPRFDLIAAAYSRMPGRSRVHGPYDAPPTVTIAGLLLPCHPLPQVTAVLATVVIRVKPHENLVGHRP